MWAIVSNVMMVVSFFLFWFDLLGLLSSRDLIYRMASDPKQAKVVRFSLFARRNKGLSEEEFHRHWSEVHGPLVVEWLARYGTVRYTQVSHYNPTIASLVCLISIV